MTRGIRLEMEGRPGDARENGAQDAKIAKIGRGIETGDERRYEKALGVSLRMQEGMGQGTGAGMLTRAGMLRMAG